MPQAGADASVHVVVIFPTLTLATVNRLPEPSTEGRLGGPVQREVKYIDRGVEYVGRYEVDGWMLELTCCYGTRRAALGLFEDRALARKLLRFLVLRAAREVAAETPHPATMGATPAMKATAAVPAPTAL